MVHTMEDTFGPTLDVEAEMREMEARLRQLAERLIERSQSPSGDAIELLSRGVALQRAAFLLRSELDAGSVDVRDSSAER